jgi:hypothetical protein
MTHEYMEEAAMMVVDDDDGMETIIPSHGKTCTMWLVLYCTVLYCSTW